MILKNTSRGLRQQIYLQYVLSYFWKKFPLFRYSGRTQHQAQLSTKLRREQKNDTSPESGAESSTLPRNYHHQNPSYHPSAGGAGGAVGPKAVSGSEMDDSFDMHNIPHR